MQHFVEHLAVSWRQCLRGQALLGVGIMGFVILLTGWLFASFSLRQPLVVGVDVSLSAMRIVGAFLVLLWIQEAFVRDVERRTVLGVFAYPVSRSVYVLGRFSGVALLVLATVTVWGGGLLVLGTYGTWGYEAGDTPQLGWPLILALSGLALDLLVIGAFMLLIVSLSVTRMLPLCIGICFALAARGIGPVTDYLRFVADADQKLKLSMLPILDALQWFLPDLSRLDWRVAVLYGQMPELLAIFQGVAGSVGYLILTLVAAVGIYKYREFS